MSLWDTVKKKARNFWDNNIWSPSSGGTSGGGSLMGTIPSGSAPSPVIAPNWQPSGTPGGGGGGGGWGPTAPTGTFPAGSFTPTNIISGGVAENTLSGPTTSGTPLGTLSTSTGDTSTYSGVESSGINVPSTLNITNGQLPDSNTIFGQLYDAANDQEKASIAQIMAEYDRQKALYENQLKYLATQKTNQISAYDTQLKGILGQIGTARTNAERDVEQGTQDIYSTANQTQRSNRNVLRALGILGSSAGGEMLTKPYTEASKQAGNMQQELVTRKKELDDLQIQKQDEYANSIKALEDNYTKLVSDIQVDQRYNDMQKMVAMQQLTAAAQQRYAELQQAQLNWNNQFAQAQQQFALDIARMQAYQGITPDINAILRGNLATQYNG